MPIVDELVSLLGLEIDPSAKATAEAFMGLLNGTTKAAGWLGAALVTVATAVEKYTMDQAKAIEEGGRFADSIGMSYQKLQAMEYATTVAGGSTQELRADLAHLFKTMSSPIPGEYNQSLYMLGNSAISAAVKSKDAGALLLALGDRFKDLSKQRQMQFADRLGISAGTMVLLRQGRAEITRLMDEARLLGIVLDDAAKNKATIFERAFRRTTAIVQGLGRSIAVGLLPGLTTATNAVSDWIVANNRFISSGIQQVVEGVGLGFRMVGDALAWAYGKFVQFLGPMGDAFKGLDATRAIAVLVAGALVSLAVSAAVAAAPFLLTAAAVAAVVVAVEDLYVAIQGGDSVIGGWVESFSAAYPNIARVLGALATLAGKFAAALGEGLVYDLQVLGRIAGKVFGAIEDMLGGIISGIDGVIKGVTKLTDFLGLTGGTDQAGAAPLGAPRNDVPTRSQLLDSLPSNKGGNTINVEINGSGDPKAVGSEVVGRLGGLGVQMTNPGMFGPTVG